jgi:hypothetical protein
MTMPVARLYPIGYRMSRLEAVWAERTIFGQPISNEYLLAEVRAIIADLESVASELQPTKENWLDD